LLENVGQLDSRHLRPFRLKWFNLSLLMVLCGLVSVNRSYAAEQYQFQAGDWVPQAKADPDSPEGRLQAARTALADDQAKKSEKLASQWIKQYPNHPLLAEAYLLRGDAKTHRKHYYKALFDYEYVIRVFSGTEYYVTAVEREYEIARLFASGVKRRLLAMRIIPAHDEAEELFIRIQERLPGSEIGEKASMDLGDFYFKRSNMDMAAEAYDLFLQNYPHSARRERALLRLIEASLATFRGPRFDSTGLLEAAERIKDFQRQFPAAADRIGADALLVRVKESLALKALFEAQWYEKRGKQVSAAYMYRRIVTDFAGTEANLRAIQRLETISPAIVKQVTQPRNAPTETEQVPLGEGVLQTPQEKTGNEKATP